MKKIFFLLIVLSNFTFGQNLSPEIEFKAIDDHAKIVKYKGDISKLVFDLTKDCTTEIQKARAIYFWITENISYDYKAYNKEKKAKVFKCKNGKNCASKLAIWEEKYINTVLKKKIGVCSGYSELYKKMCTLAGIRCEVIEGYTKTKPTQIGSMGRLNHAWNSLKIDSNYYYLDLTWASGYGITKENEKIKRFVKRRDDYYWLTPINKLSRDHFPKDTLKLINSKYNKTLFKENPYIKNTILPKIDIYSPNTGILNVKMGDTIFFKFKFTDKIDKLQINTNIARNPKLWRTIDKKEVLDEKALSKQKYIDFKKENDLYSFYYIIDSKSIRLLEVLFEYNLKLKYLVVVNE